MTKETKIILGAVIVLVVIGLYFVLSQRPSVIPPEKKPIIKIGITQIVDHPALNAVRDGFIEKMTELGYREGENISYDIQNAQGDMTVASTIAQKFVADKVNLILSIATPTSQAAVNATEEIPIVFSAVTDPIGAGLVENLENPGKNVTGMSDLTPVKEQIELIKAIVPEAKKIGTIYNPGEANSVLTNNLAKEACQDLGLELIEATADTTHIVLLAAQSLVGKVDAIYVSTDNTTVSALTAVSQVTTENKIPLVTADPTTINQEVLISLGFDYYQHGVETAPIVAEILEGKNPGSIPIKFAKELKLVINKDTAFKIEKVPGDLIAICAEFAKKLEEEGMKITLSTIQ